MESTSVTHGRRVNGRGSEDRRQKTEDKLASIGWQGVPTNGPSNQADNRQFAKRCARAENHVGCLGPRVPPTEP